MSNEFHGHLDASKMSFAIIVGRFNELVCQNLLAGAIDCLQRHGASPDQIDVYWVPGGFEIPLAAKKAAKSGKYHAIICLGAIIRGATPHFEYVAGIAANGISHVSLETEIPVLFGVLTTDNIEQALERAGTKAGNKGWEASLSAIEMIDILRKM